MIDETYVENIKKHGAFKDTGEGRIQVLKDIGLKLDKPAEYVIIGGCFQHELMPHMFSALKNLLERLNVTYTMLSKEYCCGWMPIGQPAVMAKNDEDIQKYKELSKGFIAENFKQAEMLGAKSIALFCAACEPNYSNCKESTNLELISYTELLDRHFTDGKLDLEIDYYPGCYRFRRRITKEPFNTEPALRVLKKIDRLKLNRMDEKLCCYIPPHLDGIVNGLKSSTPVTTCTGCYHNLKSSLKDKKDYRVTMLPELLLEAI
jgi:Fe-S oxidoreductase